MLNNTNTLVQFCEKKYIYSNYIAEFYNTISNIFYIIFGLYWLYFLNKNNISEINNFCYSTLFIGIGSSLLHSTNNYYMELVDEFSMVLLNILILRKFNKHYNSNKNKQSLVLINNITLFSLSSSSIYYLINKSFEFFINIYSFSIVVILSNMFLYNINNSIKFKISSSLLIGKFFWHLEQNYCYMFYPVFIFHSLWHFFTAITCYYIMNFMYITEAQKKIKNDK